MIPASKHSPSTLYTLCACFVAMILSLQVSGQGFTGTYDFSGVTASTGGRTDPTQVPTAPGVTFGSFQAVATTGALSVNPNAGGRFSFTGWPVGAVNGSDAFTGSINTGEYYEVTITPLTNYRLSLDSITFTVQRSATGIRQYAVRSSIDNFQANLPALVNPANTNLIVTGANIFQVADSATAQNGSKINLNGFNGLPGTVSLRFYGWNAEAAGGTFSIDNVKISGSAASVQGTPVITPDTTALSFAATSVNTTATPSSFTVLGENLTDQLVISTAAPYAVSATLNGTYTNSLNFSAGDAASVKTVYVQFSPTALGTFNGNITLQSTGAASKNIALSGEAVDPANLSFNFDNCLTSGKPGLGFISYSVTGAQQWACSLYGLNNTKGVDINGYSGGAVDNEDWLISSPLKISSLNLPVFRFYSRGEFTGPSLQLLISTDYDGTSNPNTATWTDLQANFPPLTNVWTLTDGIVLSPYKQFEKFYLAFKYTSSVELGAARWTLDNIEISDRSTLLSASPSTLDFNEIVPGSSSAGLPVNLQSIGYGNILLSAPSGYELSADNSNFGSTLNLSSAAAEAGTTVFIRFSPLSKALKVAGKINISGTGLDSNAVAVSGSSYPKSETFDVAAYNLSFFGSTSDNNPTPQKIATQVSNITTVLKRLNMDVLGFEEMSNDTALTQLLGNLPGYASLTSPRWSYSFQPPDPTFPPQKIGFIYNTATATLVNQRVMFEALYDSARNGLSNRLDNYPTGTASSFWASGRLPFMATFDVNINGYSKRIRMIDIHAKSSSDAESYNRRVYDVKMLKDTLDAYYPNDNIILVGDYNDRVAGSIFAGGSSPYQRFVDDASDYSVLTLPLDQAGRVSFITGTGLIDHIIISNELQSSSISNSTDIEDARTYIPNYNAATASDHLPVFTRFNLSNDGILPVQITQFEAKQKGTFVLTSWTTAMEFNNRLFIVERSADGKSFLPIAKVPGAGSPSSVTFYQHLDSFPIRGTNYYRLKQVDFDGHETLSDVVLVKFMKESQETASIFPNPVTSKFRLTLNSNSSEFAASITGTDGSIQLQAKGTISQLNQQINDRLNKLKSGLYILQLVNSSEHHSIKFVKE